MMSRYNNKYLINMISVFLLISFILFSIPNKAYAWPPDFNQFSSTVLIALVGISAIFLVIYIMNNVGESNYVDGWINSSAFHDRNTQINQWSTLIDRTDAYSDPEGLKIIAIVDKNELFYVDDIKTNNTGKWFKVKCPKKYLLK